MNVVSADPLQMHPATATTTDFRKAALPAPIPPPLRRPSRQAIVRRMASKPEHTIFSPSLQASAGARCLGTCENHKLDQWLRRWPPFCANRALQTVPSAQEMQEKQTRVPIIAMSGWGFSCDQARGLGLQVDTENSEPASRCDTPPPRHGTPPPASADRTAEMAAQCTTLQKLGWAVRCSFMKVAP